MNINNNKLIKIVKKCLKHGDLFLPDLIKSGKKNGQGGQRYKCRQCMKELHRKHYENNKKKVRDSHARYKNENPEKYRDMKNLSKRKCWALNKEKYIKKSIDYDKRNPDKKISRQKRHKNKAVQELSDSYIKQHIVRGTGMKFSNVPQDLVNLKKSVMKLKRGIKYVKQEVQKKQLNKLIRRKKS